VLLLPNFQRSFGITAPDFFDRGAKVRGLFISAKFFLFYEEKFSHFPEELSAIFSSGLQR